MALLTGLAEARGGSVSKEGYKLYTKALAKFDMRDVQVAIAEIAMEPRRERKVGESVWRDPAIPELGEVIERVKAAERKRTVIPYTRCDECDGMGMVCRRRSDGSSFAEECECKKAWRRRCAEAKSDREIAPDQKARAAGE